MATSANPLSVGRSINETLLRYIDTAFYLRDDGLRTERRRRLLEDVRLLPEPLLEPVLPYDGVVDAIEACREVGLAQDEASWLVHGLFGTSPPGETCASVATKPRLLPSRSPPPAPSNPPVVTSGTGSGEDRVVPAACARAPSGGGTKLGARAGRQRVVGDQPLVTCAQGRSARRRSSHHGALPDERARRGPDVATPSHGTPDPGPRRTRALVRPLHLGCSRRHSPAFDHEEGREGRDGRT